MSASTRTGSFLPSLLGSVLLLGSLLLASACGPSEPTRKQTEPERTLRLTAVDSLSGEPLGLLDTARAVNRTFGDSLQADSVGQFVIEDAEPALHIFDVQGYGYHTQRHVSALVEPDDSTVSARTTLLPQRLPIDCEGSRPYFWSSFVKQFKQNRKQVRFQLTSVSAEDGEVRIQPIVVNDLSSPIFIPDNFGALGHYDVTLYAGSTRIPYTYKNAPPDEGRRIYEKGDVFPVVPKEVEDKLQSSTLIVGDSIEEGTTIYARMRYTFSENDTLEATSATTFPSLNLDSLQTPVFDTLRTAGAVRVPDSLVLQRDTTIMRVVGIDTTVTRNGYVLYSTSREQNPVRNAEEARNLLYVPDPILARARRDSLEAIAETQTTVPNIDTTALAPSDVRSPLQIVERTNTPGLRSLLSDERLVQALSEGLPALDMTPDSLLSFSNTLRSAYLQTPSLSTSKVLQGVDTTPDSAEADSVILSAPASDSLFRMFSPDTLDDAPLSTRLTADTNPFLARDPNDRLESAIDSVTIDSLRLAVDAEADSVATESVVTNTLSNPPRYSYWYVPPAFSKQNNPLLVVDPSFFRLRAKARVDTVSSVGLTGLLPDRVGIREQRSMSRYPQQVARAPTGTYRSEYLETWALIQENSLKDHYCEIFPFTIQTEWGSASMR